MELKFDIGFKEFLSIIRQLPVDKKLRLKKEIDKEIANLKLVSNLK